MRAPGPSGAGGCAEPILTSSEIEAKATSLCYKTRIPKDAGPKKNRSWAFLSHTAWCSVLGQPCLDTSIQGSLGDNGVPYVESRGRVPYKL